LLGLTPPSVQWRLKIPRIRAVLRAPRDKPARRYAAALVSFTEQDKADCYAEAMQDRPQCAVLALLEPYFAEAGTLVGGANWADLHTYLPDDLLVKVDVASMAHGLEARSPLLDHVFMEWAVGLPEQVKMARGVTKALFKSAMAPYLPAELLQRPKMGFSCPIDQWFRNELKELAYDTLLSPTASGRGLFLPDYVRRLLDEHCSMMHDHHPRLWALLMLEVWFRTWIDAAGQPPVDIPNDRAKARSMRTSPVPL
jgi:asparagine synthase (glutamine-hydrolysing)